MTFCTKGGAETVFTDIEESDYGEYIFFTVWNLTFKQLTDSLINHLSIESVKYLG